MKPADVHILRILTCLFYDALTYGKTVEDSLRKVADAYAQEAYEEIKRFTDQRSKR